VSAPALLQRIAVRVLNSCTMGAKFGTTLRSVRCPKLNNCLTLPTSQSEEYSL
jgi:hypothetical protein